MLEAGAAAGAGCCHLLVVRRTGSGLLQPSIQVLQVSWMMRGPVVVQIITPDVVVALRGFCPPPTRLHSRATRVVAAVVAMSRPGAAIAVLVQVTVVVVDPLVIVVFRVVDGSIRGFLGVQQGPLTLGGGTVLPHLVHKEDFGHVVDDEHFGPVGDWFGLGAAEMNVHDKDGERSGSGDHRHGGDVVFPWRSIPEKMEENGWQEQRYTRWHSYNIRAVFI